MRPLTPIDQQLGQTVLRAHLDGIALQSDFFRSNAPYVAMAASLGYLTTHIGGNEYCSEWHPTSRGLRWLEKTFGKKALVAAENGSNEQKEHEC
jgi:hypothetical protein